MKCHLKLGFFRTKEKLKWQEITMMIKDQEMFESTFILFIPKRSNYKVTKQKLNLEFSANNEIN